jgi:hypothetical protein
VTPPLINWHSVEGILEKNPDDKQTMHVSDPKKKLKPRGYLKQTTTSTSKVYQPKPTQSNAKVPPEHLTLQEGSTQIYFGETSTNRIEAEIINPELVLPKIKVETDLTASFTNKGKKPISIPALIDIPSVPEVKFQLPEVSKNISYTLIQLLLVLPFIYPANLKNLVLISLFPPFLIFCLLTISSQNLFCFIPK